jgi:NTP pyrophosphatase (non-canonical NTP hydrolase)
MTDKLIKNAMRCRDQLVSRSPLTGDAALLGQALKVQEEAGEMAEAMLGVLGQNPRKGFSHTKDDLLKEIIDVIMTSAVLAVWIEGGPAFAARLDERLDFLAERAER